MGRDGESDAKQLSQDETRRGQPGAHREVGKIRIRMSDQVGENTRRGGHDDPVDLPDHDPQRPRGDDRHDRHVVPGEPGDRSPDSRHARVHSPNLAALRRASDAAPP